MSEHLRQLSSYLGHLVKARNRHGVHSPFVYDLIAQVLRPSDVLPAYAEIEQARADLLDSDQTIRVNDLGAGSRVHDQALRRVADMARTALKPPKQAQLLYRLARYLDARQVLELGTSFGITTLYLASGAEEGDVHTIEGCPHLGSFRSALPDVLRRMDTVDLVFIDGHHAEGPTREYFELCLQHAHNDTVLVLDDIHWSRGMEAAWSAIKAHPRVTVTIDLYSLGLVFLRSEQAKEHFRLRY
ncbi:MAG: class I SAM-dependent methyltransferase [Flavobacteriales bacterium]|nr:class I SAM-dependent methyltransferase [Flavobacteriales bacterium]